MNRSRFTSSLVLLLSSVAATTALAQTPLFEGIGDLAGGAVSSAAHGISDDGSVVVGESEGASGGQAIRWTLGGGLTGLGFLPGGSAPSVARAVSANGAVIVGSGKDSSGVTRAFRYSGSSFTILAAQGCSDCDPVTEGLGVSGDGLVALGYSVARSSGTSPLHVDPVRWPNGGSSLSNLGNLSGDEEVGEAHGASYNGAVIVGSHFRNWGQDAFVWTGSGLSALAHVTGMTPRTASALGVSTNGSTLVGYASKSTLTLPGGTVVPVDRQAVRWTGTGYMTLSQLGSLPGAPVTSSQANATNDDGSIIVGVAVNAAADDVAFIWDAANGMRELKTVLVDEYGLDLTGWTLTSASDISDNTASGFWVTGTGVNPSGQPEGWVAFVVDPACSDGIDNEPDGATDHPADTGCTSPTDWSEILDCQDGIDNDGDGDIDSPDDGGCRDANDPTERPDCADGLDNDGDGLFDLDDPGCKDASSAREDPACSDGLDNDGDTHVDHPADLQCQGPWDVSEVAACSDGFDNDGDALVDHPADPDCASPAALSESPACSDGVDNDGDGRTDYPDQYPGCTGPDDPIEKSPCNDGIDNDGDGDIDFPADAECTGLSGESESRVDLLVEALYVVDRTSRTLFRVDLGNGVQTLVSQAAVLQAPQGLDRRGGNMLVADPTGLIAVSGEGVQNVLTPPLLANESLQVEVDASGLAFLLEADGIYTHASGDPSTTLWLPVPSPEPLPNLSLLDGDTLALEDAGSVVTTGLGFLGGGVIRIDPNTKVAAPLDWGVFARARWNDIAVEDTGTFIAVGREFDLGTGVYRIDPGTGAATVLNNTHPWLKPTGVTVDRDTGSIWVADAGTCADGTCSGGSIHHVDPISGAVTPLASGGYIAGELDIVYVPEPGMPVLFVLGLFGLAGLASLRAARLRRRDERPGR